MTTVSPSTLATLFRQPGLTSGHHVLDKARPREPQADRSSVRVAG